MLFFVPSSSLPLLSLFFISPQSVFDRPRRPRSPDHPFSIYNYFCCRLTFILERQLVGARGTRQRNVSKVCIANAVALKRVGHIGKYSFDSRGFVTNFFVATSRISLFLFFGFYNPDPPDNCISPNCCNLLVISLAPGLDIYYSRFVWTGGKRDDQK